MRTSIILALYIHKCTMSLMGGSAGRSPHSGDSPPLLCFPSRGALIADFASTTVPGSGGFTLTTSPGGHPLRHMDLDRHGPLGRFPEPNALGHNRPDAFGVSLFDSGSNLSTPDSGPGIPGVVYPSGVAIGGSTNLLPWADESHLGVINHAVDFTLLDGGLIAGLSTSFRTDTDVMGVPEPCSAALLGIGLLALLRKFSASIGRARVFKRLGDLRLASGLDRCMCAKFAQPRSHRH